MINISIGGYLTEDKLHQILIQIFGSDNIIRNSKIPNSKMKYDFLIEKHKLIIEFDGDSHYRDINVIKRDLIKNNIAKTTNYKLIRIPYFIQLTNKSFDFYFNLPNLINITQNYKHGFIDKKATLPASFCELGIDRFINEYTNLPTTIQTDINISIYNLINNTKSIFVIPSKLITLLNLDCLN